MDGRFEQRQAAGPNAATLALVVAATLLGSGCARVGGEEEHHGSDREEEESHGTPAARGPRGGRLFEGDGVRLELLVAEDGIPPEFRAHLYDERNRAVALGSDRLWVILERFGGRRDSVGFRVEGDRFRAVRPVEEPHSFDAQVLLERGGRQHQWAYRQREGRVELSPEAVAAGGIAVGIAGPRPIAVQIETLGEVRLNAERVVEIRPRFPGLVQRLAKRVGDWAASGDLLAVVHSNESLADYEILAPMRGTVVAQGAALGQAVDQGSMLYAVADLSTVWVDLALYQHYAVEVRPGQQVEIRAGAGNPLAAGGTINYVGPLLAQDTRVASARVVLPNPDGKWKPGLFVNGTITVDRFEARVAAPEEAIVRTSRGPAVFRADRSMFELQPVLTGRSDGSWTEILQGLEPGDPIVVANAFLLKAELGKSEATHEH